MRVLVFGVVAGILAPTLKMNAPAASFGLARRQRKIEWKTPIEAQRRHRTGRLAASAGVLCPQLRLPAGSPPRPAATPQVREVAATPRKARDRIESGESGGGDGRFLPAKVQKAQPPRRMPSIPVPRDPPRRGAEVSPQGRRFRKFRQHPLQDQSQLRRARLAGRGRPASSQRARTSCRSMPRLTSAPTTAACSSPCRHGPASSG